MALVLAALSFSTNNSLDDIYIIAVLGWIGRMFTRQGTDAAHPGAPLHLGTAGGGNFRRAMLPGDFSIFVSRPIDGTLLAISAVIVAWRSVSSARKHRQRRAAAARAALRPAPRVD